jgi:hypothetical protein
MKSLLICFNFILAFLAMSIDTELSPLWAVVCVVAWMCIAAWLLVQYASPIDALRGLVKIRRYWRLLWRPKFDFEAFNKRFARETEAKRSLTLK